MPRVVALVALAVVAAPAAAQPQPPLAAQRPAFSPYLNLLSRGNNPGFNYLGIVRPQLQAQQQLGQLQQQLRQTNQNVQDLGNAGLYAADPTFAVTGHAAVFNNTNRYFGNNPAFGGGGALTSSRASSIQSMPQPAGGRGASRSAGGGLGRGAAGTPTGGRR